MSLDKLFSANDETSTIRSSQLLFLYQERIPPDPRVGLWYTVTGEERAVGQAVGTIANSCVIRSAPVAVQEWCIF